MKLLQNEALDFSPATADYPTLTDEQINRKYVKGDVRIVTEQARYPLESVPAMLNGTRYKLNPEYQRRRRWDNAKKSLLIESFIINVPVPPIFLYEVQFSQYEVMDGLQRLTTIADFYANRFALEGLTEWPELIGRTYSALPEQIQRGIDRRYISSIILLQETAKLPADAQYLKQLVFERINSGGVSLEPQESRNAIYNGALNRLCLELSRTKALCELWGIPAPVGDEAIGPLPAELIENKYFREMYDVELVLRFFAYRQRSKRPHGAFRNFLDDYQKLGNSFPPSVLDGLRQLFLNTISLAQDLLGEEAFWLWRNRDGNWDWLARSTTAVYDPLMFVLSQFTGKQAEKLLRQRDSIRENIKAFYEQSYETFEGRNTNPSILDERDAAFTQFFEQYI
ncbi:hypothetical protein PLCT2_01547 [Planctomycetaceae bacterium]|nr:hypothetical protein PLCT2_01547 [Planctomycetaceae bacterium]